MTILGLCQFNSETNLIKRQKLSFGKGKLSHRNELPVHFIRSKELKKKMRYYSVGKTKVHPVFLEFFDAFISSSTCTD